MKNNTIICWGCFTNHNRVYVIPVKWDLTMYDCPKCGVHSTGIDVEQELTSVRLNLKGLLAVEKKLNKAYISKAFNKAIKPS